MARRQQVLARSYNYLAVQCVSDTQYDAPKPLVTYTHYQEIMFLGKLLKLVSSSGETGRRKGLKIPR
jgi:hypothetical protein